MIPLEIRAFMPLPSWSLGSNPTWTPSRAPQRRPRHQIRNKGAASLTGRAPALTPPQLPHLHFYLQIKSLVFPFTSSQWINQTCQDRGECGLIKKHPSCPLGFYTNCEVRQKTYCKADTFTQAVIWTWWREREEESVIRAPLDREAVQRQQTPESGRPCGPPGPAGGLGEQTPGCPSTGTENLSTTVKCSAPTSDLFWKSVSLLLLVKRISSILYYTLACSRAS